MLDQSQPIALTHDGILLDKAGRKWRAGKYAPNTVPFELTEDVRGSNFEASEKQEYSKVPVLGEEPEPAAQLEVKTDTVQVAKVEAKPAPAPVPALVGSPAQNA